MFGGTVFGVLGGPTASAATLTTVATVASQVGAALVLGGVAQIISPQPPAPPEFDNDPRNNYGFSGIQQTAREGSTIPVVYGETLVGSIIISQGLNVDEVA
jgi:predicted phage tail protein